MDIDKTLNLAIIFCLGFLSCVSIIGGFSYFEIEKPMSYLGYTSDSEFLETPSEWISESQIQIYEDKIVINIDDASLGHYAPTGSMKPILDSKTNGIRIVPDSEEQIKVGDIISFKQDKNLIIHRVVEKGEDSEGTYFITKGDNNSVLDGKIRFEQIKYVTVGFLY